MSVSSWLTSVAEYVAPRTHTRFDRLRDDWLAIKELYRADASPSDEEYHAARVPARISDVVTALVDEAREDAEGNTEGECMEYVLQERIFDVFGVLGTRDAPAGIRRLLYTLLAELLAAIRTELLHLDSVHRCLVKLVSSRH